VDTQENAHDPGIKKLIEQWEGLSAAQRECVLMLVQQLVNTK